MKQLLLLAVALLGHVWSQPCGPQKGEWMSPINLQGPRYEPTFKPLHVFSFLAGGEGLVVENTGDTVWITYPIRPDIPSTHPNLTDIQISKGPLADKYTADHVEFRWGPATLPFSSSSSSTGAGVAPSQDSSSSSSGGAFLLETNENVVSEHEQTQTQTQTQTTQAQTQAQAGQSATTTVSAEWGSDHGFSGNYFPLEMQVHFYNTKHKSYAEAAAASPQEPDSHDINEDIVALSVLFEVGDQNEELLKITDRLQLIQTSGATTPILAKMCFEKILGPARDFITYPGSLTRAPCTRGVRWIVLVETLTVSQSQLDQFRLIHLDNPAWVAPLDQPLNGRLVQTNLKELPLDDKFIPAFHPHGPPLNVLSPDVDGTVINPNAINAEDAAYKNYWSPFDYTIEDSDTGAAAQSTILGYSTGTIITGGTITAAAPTDTGAATSGGASGGASAFFLEATAATTTGVSGGDGGGGTGGTGGVQPAPTGGATGPSQSTNAPQTDDHHVNIPNFFHLSTVAYFTPDFQPNKHHHDEENHYHPPSADTDSDVMPSTDDDSTSFKGKKGKSLNPDAPVQPRLKQKAKSQKQQVKKQQVKKQKKAAADTQKKPMDPKTAFLNGKRAQK